MTTPLLDYWCQTLDDDSFSSPAAARVQRNSSFVQPLPPADEAVRIARLCAGDIAELERLFREVAAPLCRFAERVGVTNAEAEEIIADVFFHLWEHRGTLDSVTRLRPYLYSAVRNRALNARRREQRTTAREFVAMQAIHHDSSRTAAEDCIEHDETAGRVWQAVHHLPEAQRTAVELRFAHELPLAEVAEVLGISTPAVKMLIQRAIRTLRSTLGGIFEAL
jgi:RNA polymerase sigma-70 factor (ECF subfamily)